MPVIGGNYYPEPVVCEVSLGQLIRARRKVLKLTLDDIAVDVETGKGHLSEIENGFRKVGFIKAALIARRLGLDLNTMATLALKEHEASKQCVKKENNQCS